MGIFRRLCVRLNRQQAPLNQRSRRVFTRPYLDRLENRIAPIAGGLDPTFGVGGIAATQFIDSVNNLAEAAAVQADGKLVVAGRVKEVQADVHHINLVRYNLNGSLDSSFGTAGIVTTSMSMEFDVAGVAIEPDGSVLVAGTSTSGYYTPYTSQFGVLHYTANGILDTTFGAGGLVTTGFGTNLHQNASSIAIVAGGRFVVAGATDPGSAANWDLALAVYNADGSLDSSFGSAGKATIARAAGIIAVQPDGKIVAAGSALARFTTAGTLDPTFGTGGIVSTAIAGGSASAIAIQPDGRIIVAGGIQNRLALARYQADGTLDTTFGTGGLVVQSSMERATSIVLEADGKIVAGSITNEHLFALARFNPTNGGLDPTFGTGGVATASFSSYADDSGLVLQGANLVQVGYFANLDTGYDFALARYLPTGALDPTFGNAGKRVTDIREPVDPEADEVVVQPDGKIIMAGSTFASEDGNGGDKFALARFNPDGSLDATFGAAGKVVTDLNNRYAVNTATLQADGKLLVAGSSSFLGGSLFPLNLVLARYNADGSLDPSFGSHGEVLASDGDSSGRYPYVVRVEVQSDGKIVMLETSSDDLGSSYPELLRFNANGSPDASFGNAGSMLPGVLAIDSGYDFTVLPGHRLLVAGDQGLSRYNADGSLDTTFGSGGTLAFPGRARTLMIQRDGRMVVAGRQQNNLVVSRYNADLTVDSTFGTGGTLVLTPNTAQTHLAPNRLVVQADGRIVLGGFVVGGSPYYAPLVARSDPNGKLDTTFGAGGLAQVASLNPGSIALQADGKILITTASGVARLLAADPLQNYVLSLYHTVLNRTPAPAEVNPWIQFLNNGGTRAQISAIFWESAEHRGLQVDGYYQTFLHRPADPLGRAGWVAAMVGGMTENQVVQIFLASPEFQAAHASNAAYIDSLYATLLERPESPQEQAAWLALLQTGGTRDQAAHGFLTTLEHYTKVVDHYYLALLHRPADAAGEAAWARLLAAPMITLDGVAEAFLASDEFVVNS